MKIVVCGAGVIGVTSAWYLSQSGHEVTVVDRLSAPAEETSFANGGQVSVGHTEPWAQPDILLKILQWLGDIEAPIRFRPQLALSQWQWGLQFLLQCRHSCADHNTQRLAALGLYSLQELQKLRNTLQLDYDGLQKGILHLYSHPADFEKACRRAEYIEKQGIERKIVDRNTCLALEPALTHTHVPIVGGTYTSTDESGDAQRFTKALAQAAMAKGVTFQFNTEIIDIHSIRPGHFKISTHSSAGQETLQAEAVVIAAGAWSVPLLAPLNVRIPVYPLKGYSATFEIDDPALAPSVSLTDESKKMVFSRFGNRYRAAGMAELSGFDKTIDNRRAQLLTKRVNELFPKAMNEETVEYWTGLRPATPTNVPIISTTSLPGLFINTGHGTLGWTLSCGSAAFLTALVNRTPHPLNADFYRC